MTTAQAQASNDLRLKARQIVTGAGVPFEKVLPKLDSAGDPDIAAQNGFAAQAYLDKVHIICREILLEGLPMPTAAEAKAALTGPKNKRPRHDAAQGWADTTQPNRGSEAKALILAGGLSQYINIITAYARSLSYLHNDTDDYFLKVIKLAIAVIKGQPGGKLSIVGPELSTLMETAMADKNILEMSDEEILAAVKSAGNNFGVDIDELTGKPLVGSLTDVIEGEIVESKLPDIAAPETDATKVAKLLTDGLPNATKDYKQFFFEQATGHKSVSSCIKAIGSAQMFNLLRESLKEALPIMPSSPKPEDRAKEAPVATPAPEITIDATVTKSEPQSGQTSSALTISASVAPMAPAVQSRAFLMPTPQEWQYMTDMARFVANSKFYPGVDTQDKAMVILMKGYSLGIEPLTALEGIHIIGGKPSLGSNLMLSLANKSGLIRDVRIVGDERQCQVTMWRKDRPEPQVETFTMADAITAGLPNRNQTWKSYPKAMLKARAISSCFRATCPELATGIRGIADDDEVDEEKMIASEMQKAIA